jgi:hypothetical protein
MESSEDNSSNDSAPINTGTSIPGLDVSTLAGNPSDLTVPETSVVRPSVKIKHTLRFFDTITSEWNMIQQDDLAFDLGSVPSEIENDSSTSNPPEIFEIFTKATAFDKRRPKELKGSHFRMRGLGQDDAHSLPHVEEPVKLEHLKITEVTETRIEIYSQCLLQAIREVVDYYPRYSPISSTI